MLRKIKITRRLGLIFSLLGLLTSLVGAIAVVHFWEIEEDIQNITERRMPATKLAGELTREFLLIRLYTVNLLSTDSDIEFQHHLSALTEAMQNFSKISDQASKFHQSVKGHDVYNTMLNAKQQYDRLHKQLLDLIQKGQKEEAKQFHQQGFYEASTKVTENLGAIVAYQQATANKLAREEQKGITLAIEQMLITIGVTLLISLFFAVYFSRSLNLPLGNAVEISQRIASGDLSQSIEDVEPDEMGDLIRAMAQMQQQLKQTIGEINLSSSQLASTSEELSTVTEQSSQTLHQQSQEMEMAATAVTELTTAIEEVARNAATVSYNSEQADAKAQQGREQVVHTIKTVTQLEQELQQSRGNIEQLAQSVNRISSVLDVIRAIAEQTNLLALNAAIEAARAGESGRGFAVVADEVRALAHRTQESTKEIERMMQTVQTETLHTVDTMKSSSRLAIDTVTVAQKAGDALQQITIDIAQISQQNLTIAGAAEEQATVAREVDANLVNIRDLSTQTATGANETQASSAELARLAESLNQLVIRFKV